MRLIHVPALTICLLFLCGPHLSASEKDELRERAKAMRKEAAALAEGGNPEKAEHLLQEAKQLLEAAERAETKAEPRGKTEPRAEGHERQAHEQEVQHLKERLRDLHAHEQELRDAKASEQDLAEARERTVGTEQELQRFLARRAQSMAAHERGPQAERLAAAQRRVHHLRVAAESLKLAEAHDLAMEIMRRAENMEREIQEAKRRLMTEMHAGQEEPHGPGNVRELKAEIERLRAEVNELRQQAEKR